MLRWDTSDVSNPSFITRICCKNTIEDVFFFFAGGLSWLYDRYILVLIFAAYTGLMLKQFGTVNSYAQIGLQTLAE